MGVGITVENKGEVIGCGGVVLFEPDKGELWLRVSKKASPLALMTGTRAGLKILRKSFPGVEFTCRVRDGFERGHAFVSRLGFKRQKLEDKYWTYSWQQHS